MNIEEIQALMTSTLDGCEVHLEGQGNHLTVTVIGDIFDGKRPVQRQQQVYAVLKEYIADGAVHAVNMKLYTPSEWQAV